MVGKLIKDMGDEPIIDIVKSFSSALPTIVIADLLGVPSEDRFLFKEWVDHLFLPLPIDNIEDVRELKRQAARNYYNYLYPHVVAKRTHLTDDIISDLIRAEVDGERLTDDEIVRMTMFLLGAGIETTSHLLANTFYSFLYDNDQIYAEVQSHREPASEYGGRNAPLPFPYSQNGSDGEAG